MADHQRDQPRLAARRYAVDIVDISTPATTCVDIVDISTPPLVGVSSPANVNVKYLRAVTVSRRGLASDTTHTGPRCQNLPQFGASSNTGGPQ